MYHSILTPNAAFLKFKGTSEIALGEKGAERLLGKGHAAVKLEGEEAIITAQVPFITTEEIETIVSEISINH